MMIGWLLLVLLAVVGGGAAALGVVQAPKSVPLEQAVNNTLSATNYSEVLTETTQKGSQTDYLTFESPDRLGGYIQAGDKRFYIYVIDGTEYQSLTVSPGTPPDHLVFYDHPSQVAADFDPAHGYLPFAGQGKNIQQSGTTYSFSLAEDGGKQRFVFTVTGKYVSEVTLDVEAPSASLQLLISQVGTSPPVALPSGAKLVSATSGTAG